MRFEQLRAQFQFMREHGIETESQMEAFGEEAEAKLKTLTKQRTILNVQKKKRQPLFQALADEEALSPVKTLYADGLSGMEEEYAKYAEAVHKLDTCGISREALTAQKAELYTKLADLNREIREARKQQKMCQEILSEVPTIQKHIDLTERDEQTEVRKHDIKRR
jgi:HEAT repeat protein